MGSPFSPDLFFINLDSDTVQSVALPPQELPAGGSLRPRITGDMAVSPSGYEVVVPGLYVDNTTPINDNVPPPSTGYYGATESGSGKLNPTMAVIPVSSTGEPLPDYSFVLLVSSRDFNGYPAGATFDPKGDIVYLPIEGGQGIIATSIDTGSAKDENVLEKYFDGGASSPFVFDFNPIQLVKTTGAGPRSVTFLEKDRAFTHEFIDNQIENLGAGQVENSLRDDQAVAFGGTTFTAQRPIKVAGEALPPDVAAGRRLFYTSDDRRMSAPFTGLACATCHFDGRNDGLTWTFARGGRQTPSLAGKVSLTEPVRWEGDRETVQEDAIRTSKEAMGGDTSLTTNDLDRLAAFVDWTRDPDVPVAELDAGAVARGRGIFERSDVGCAGCHNGPRMTNNQLYDMLGIDGVKTRPLVGIATSPPYFHNGSAATLMDVLERSRDGSMGNTSMLSDAEMHDLAEYLRSL